MCLIIVAHWPRTARSVARMESFESTVWYTTPGSLDSQSRQGSITPAFCHYADHESSHHQAQYSFNSTHTSRRHANLTSHIVHAHIQIPNLDDHTRYVTFDTHILTSSSYNTQASHYILFIYLSSIHTTNRSPPIRIFFFVSRISWITLP